MLRVRTTILLASLAIGLLGCGGWGGAFLASGAGRHLSCPAPKKQNLYFGPSRPVEQVARIARGNRPFSGPTLEIPIQWIVQLDGAPIPGRAPGQWWCVHDHEISVLPGHHRAIVMHDFEKRFFAGPLLGKSPIYSKTYHSMISFDAEAGHRYVPHSRCEAVGTPKESCKAWLVDEETGKVVARDVPAKVGDPQKRPPWREQKPKEGEKQQTDG